MSDYYSMGIRMYSAEFGRFLAVDPLFEAMPRHTPYHYGFNSPLVYCNPSGLVPEKEKNGEKLQTFAPIVWEMVMEQINEMLIEVGRTTAQRVWKHRYNSARERLLAEGWSESQIEYIDEVFGGGGKSPRTGASAELVTTEVGFNKDGTIYIKYGMKITNSNGEKIIPIERLETPERMSIGIVYDRLNDGFQKILNVDPFYFDKTGKNISIAIASSSMIGDIYFMGSKNQQLPGLHQDNGDSQTIWLANEFLLGDEQLEDNRNFHYPNETGKGSISYQFYAVIAHEFGHNIDYNYYGSYFYHYYISSNDKEDSAINKSNIFRMYYNHIPETLKSKRRIN